MEHTEVPHDTYAAADWLRSRHPWLDELLTRVCGPARPESTDRDPAAFNKHWVDDITEAFDDLAANGQAWRDYERRHPEPRGMDNDAEYAAWIEAGPKPATTAAQLLAPMSSGEIRMLRLVTTLGTGDRCVQGWRVDDLAFDDRGRRVVEDWVRVVLRQFQ